jgi:SanA protein
MAGMLLKYVTWKNLRRWFWRTLGLLIAVAAGANLWVLGATQGQIFRELARLPQDSPDVALVLGTSKTLPNGWANHFFQRRMEAAAKLYHAGKVHRLLVSGDNESAHYNEPADMRDALIAKGVPVSAITLDFAGLRTLDSVVRAKEIFGLQRCLIVTDDFHLPRAIFLANHFGLAATGFETQPLDWDESAKTRLREALARVKLLLDLYLLATEPKHLGIRQELPQSPASTRCTGISRLRICEGGHQRLGCYGSTWPSLPTHFLLRPLHFPALL